MRPLDILLYAANALVQHRRRSLLSLLGVVIGVVSVIFLTALGEGARSYVVDQFASLGTRLMIVVPGKNETTGIPGAGGVPNDLTLQDTRALQRELRGAQLVVPVALGPEQVSHGERSRQSLIVGTTADYLAARELTMGRGSFLPESELERGAPVAVIGTKLANELFPGDTALGKTLRIADQRVRVIGVLAPGGTRMGENTDEMVVVPVALAMRLFNRSSLFRILVQMSPDVDDERMKRQLIAILTERHGEEDVMVLTQEAILGSLSSILGALTLALAGIASISLAVAGIGIMNVMLVSVSERTPEIGLLKALGATRRQMLAVFLTEAVLLSCCGGALGLVTGWGLVGALVWYYPALPATTPLWAVVSVLLICVGSGGLFGILPALRAVRLDPVRALSH